MWNFLFAVRFLGHYCTYLVTDKAYFWHENDDYDFWQYVPTLRLHLICLVISTGSWVNLSGGRGVVVLGGSEEKSLQIFNLQSLASLWLCRRPGGYSPIKVTGVLVVPLRGLNLWIGTAHGAKTENDCWQSCLGKIYDNTFKKVFGRKYSKVAFYWIPDDWWCQVKSDSLGSNFLHRSTRLKEFVRLRRESINCVFCSVGRPPPPLPFFILGC